MSGSFASVFWRLRLSLRLWQMIAESLLRKKKYDVIFYSSGHFFRSEHYVPELLAPQIQACLDDGLAVCLMVEAPLRVNVKRYPEYAVLAPITTLRVLYLISRIIGLEGERSDRFIGRILSKSIFRRVKTKVFVTLANSMVQRAQWIWPESRLYDNQHGIIYAGHSGYFTSDGRLRNSFQSARVGFLGWGRRFADVLRDAGSSNAHVIGVSVPSAVSRISSCAKGGVVITLQRICSRESGMPDMTLRDEIAAWSSLVGLLSQDVGALLPFVFIKEHPRSTLTPEDLRPLRDSGAIIGKQWGMLGKCSVACHITVNSTTAFEMAAQGIPTILVDLLGVVTCKSAASGAGSPSLKLVQHFSFPRRPLRCDEIPEMVTRWRQVNRLWENAASADRQWSSGWIEQFSRSRWLALIKDSAREVQ